MHQNYPSRHKWCAGLHKKNGSDEAVSETIPVADEEHKDWHDNVMTHNQGSFSQEIGNIRPRHGDPVLGESVVHQVHGHQVIDEVGNPKVEIAVNNVNLDPHKVSVTLSVDKPSHETGAYCE